MHTIELSTLVFYKGELPRTLALKDWAMPLATPVPGAFTALYGYQSKQEGFVAAASYAKERQLQFTIIDFVVTLAHKPNVLKMQADTLPEHDFLNFTRMNRNMDEPVKQWMLAHPEVKADSAELLDTLKPMHAATKHPSLISALLQHKSCQHLKVVAYPAMTALSSDPLNVGSVPLRHWGAIESAQCRLDPSVTVSLEMPAG
jgi:hypothetical protein